VLIFFTELQMIDSLAMEGSHSAGYLQSEKYWDSSQDIMIRNLRMSGLARGLRFFQVPRLPMEHKKTTSLLNRYGMTNLWDIMSEMEARTLRTMCGKINIGDRATSTTAPSWL
jgi:hypothetical protein